MLGVLITWYFLSIVYILIDTKLEEKFGPNNNRWFALFQLLLTFPLSFGLLICLGILKITGALDNPPPFDSGEV